MGDLYEQLNDLYKLQIAAKELRHGIKKESWSLFEPSKFVYAFFAFNSFYSIDWDESAKEQKLIKWEFIKNGDSDKGAGKTESQKISEMRKFICNTNVNDSMVGKEKEDAKTNFATRLSEKLKNYLEENATQTIESLSGIETDINIDDIMKQKFIAAFENLLNDQLKGKKFNDALDTTLKFVFSVRNNIFHGTKTVIDMMGSGQQTRLQIYTAILLSINEMLFEAVENRFKWSREQVDSDLNRKNIISTRAIERRFYDQTVASKYGITIPNGPLFYPCVGNDTFEPMKLFIDSISEFHFVDSKLIPKSPRLGIRVSGYDDEDNSGRQSSRMATNLMFPRELISGAKAFNPADGAIDIQKINDLKLRGIKFADYNGQVGKIYKQEWELAKDNKKIEIYKHRQDGLATFISLDKISVFYLRRDSEGEGGSGQRWFQKNLFEIILDKLMDGGLIVTDGSGFDPTIIENAQWRALWANRSSGRKNGNIDNIPDDFEYYHRKFKCLGECGRGYGPVYVWQVTMI